MLQGRTADSVRERARKLGVNYIPKYMRKRNDGNHKISNLINERKL